MVIIIIAHCNKPKNKILLRFLIILIIIIHKINKILALGLMIRIITIIVIVIITMINEVLIGVGAEAMNKTKQSLKLHLKQTVIIFSINKKFINNHILLPIHSFVKSLIKINVEGKKFKMGRKYI